IALCGCHDFRVFFAERPEGRRWFTLIASSGALWGPVPFVTATIGKLPIHSTGDRCLKPKPALSSGFCRAAFLPANPRTILLPAYPSCSRIRENAGALAGILTKSAKRESGDSSCVNAGNIGPVKHRGRGVTATYSPFKR